MLEIQRSKKTLLWDEDLF